MRSFEEFCRNFNVSKKERTELVYFLANYRAMVTIENLLKFPKR
jgi:hypothetical protein